MCGIAGIASLTDQRAAQDAVRVMTCALARRGPDGEGLEAWPACVLGHRRLAIFDPSEAGRPSLTQTFLIPAFGTIQPPFTQLFTFTSPGATFQGTMASLTVDILGSTPDFVIPGGPQAGQRVDSFTYDFRVAQPVPEPGTMIILATGLAGVLENRRRSRK